LPFVRGHSPTGFAAGPREPARHQPARDALGKAYYVQSPPDPSLQAGDAPTTLITYKDLPHLFAAVTTTRLSVADYVGSASAAIDLDYPHTRINREVKDSAGHVILQARRLDQFETADWMVPIRPAADGYAM
jgi:hypothetical protein